MYGMFSEQSFWLKLLLLLLFLLLVILLLLVVLLGLGLSGLVTALRGLGVTSLLAWPLTKPLWKLGCNYSV